MKKLIKKLEDIMVAVTFAEAGEYDEVRRLTNDQSQKEQQSVNRPLQDFKKTALEGVGK